MYFTDSMNVLKLSFALVNCDNVILLGFSDILDTQGSTEMAQ